MSDERLERFKRRVDADFAPIRNLMDELRADLAALDAEMAEAAEKEDRD